MAVLMRASGERLVEPEARIPATSTNRQRCRLPATAHLCQRQVRPLLGSPISLRLGRPGLSAADAAAAAEATASNARNRRWYRVGRYHRRDQDRCRPAGRNRGDLDCRRLLRRAVRSVAGRSATAVRAAPADCDRQPSGREAGSGPGSTSPELDYGRPVTYERRTARPSAPARGRRDLRRRSNRPAPALLARPSPARHRPTSRGAYSMPSTQPSSASGLA